jgi:hypothetical protein
MPEQNQNKTFDPTKTTDANKNNYGQLGNKDKLQTQPGQRPDQSSKYGQIKNPDAEDEEK